MCNQSVPTFRHGSAIFEGERLGGDAADVRHGRVRAQTLLDAHRQVLQSAHVIPEHDSILCICTTTSSLHSQNKDISAATYDIEFDKHQNMLRIRAHNAHVHTQTCTRWH